MYTETCTTLYLFKSDETGNKAIRKDKYNIKYAFNPFLSYVNTKYIIIDDL